MKRFLSRWFGPAARDARQTRRPQPHCRPRLELLEDRLAPAVHQWTGAVNTLWSNAGNWIGGSPAGDSSAVLIFPASGVTNYTSNNDVMNFISSLDFRGSGFNITGNNFQINTDGLVAENTTGVNTVNQRVAFSGRVSVFGSVLNLASNFNNAGDFFLRGGGTLQLGGVDSAIQFLNATVDSFTTLRLGSNNALPQFTNIILDGNLDLNNFNLTLSSLTSGGNVTLGSGTLTLGTRDVSNTFAGTISGTGGLTKVGSGTLTLTGALPYTGATEVKAGTLRVGPLTVSVSSGSLTVDDSTDTTARTITHDTVAVGGSPYGRITGLALAALQYKYADTSSATLHTGTGGATVTVRANGVPTSLVGHSGSTAVTVGNNGLLHDILASVTISNPPSFTAVTVDDSAEPVAFPVTLDTVTLGGGVYGRISFGGPPIQYKNADTASATLHTGIGGATVTVRASSVPTTLVSHGGNTAINVGNSANRLDDLGRPLTINGQAGTTTLTINDQGTTTSKTYEVYADAVKRVVTPGTYDAVVNYAGVQSLTLNGGSGGNVFSILGTAAGTSTTLNGNAPAPGGDEFVAYADHEALLGPLALHGRPGSNSYVEYYDYVNAASQTYTFTTNTVSRSGLAPTTYDGLNQVILYASRVGGNTINVPSMAPIFDNFVAADGDVVTLGSNGSLAAVQGELSVGTYGTTTVTVDDSADPAALPGSVTFQNAGAAGYGISGLIPYGIYLRTSDTSNLNVNIRTGAGDKTFNLREVNSQPGQLAISLDAGGGTNTLDYTGYAGNVLVNLPLGTATGFSTISRIQNVKGASGGPAGSYNLLVGNGGNVLTGGNGRRNLLIGGGAASTLVGGDGEDILIAGTTDYDTNTAALLDIMSVWTGADSYANRVARLVDDPSYAFSLNAATVHSNGGGNTLTGKPGGSTALDLYFANLDQGDTTDAGPDDRLVSIV